jgi:hypothetical protein
MSSCPTPSKSDEERWDFVRVTVLPGCFRSIMKWTWAPAIRRCRFSAIIANLTPFRGPSADAGTVYELGYMAGRGRLCLGYSNDPSPYADRVREFTKVTLGDGSLKDAQGLTVEDFGLSDNLMMIHALDLHGCALVTPPQGPSNIWRDLTSFEICVRMAAARLGVSQSGSG